MNLSPSLLIIEDHEAVTFSVKLTILENFSGATVHQAFTLSEGLALMSKSCKYDVVILDIDIPGGKNSHMVQMIRRLQSGTRILIFSGKDEQPYALEFLEAGANGFLSKKAPLHELGAAIRTVLSGRKYMSHEVQQIISEIFFHGKSHQQNKQKELSPRESEVLELLKKGMINKEIANELHLQLSTVGTLRARILEKMGVSNMFELGQKLAFRSP